jgi:hypothetical protein
VFWAAGSTSQTVFEVRIHSALEANDYVVYTTNNYWTMDIATWARIAGGTEQTGNPPAPDGIPGKPGHLVGQKVTFVVRGTSTSGGTPFISNTATIVIAPALAAGSLIFWSTASFATTSTDLQGFRVGDLGTTTALTPGDVAQGVWAQPPDGGNLPQPVVLEKVGCIGCHTATPDGQYVGFTAQWPWPNALASVQAGSTGSSPPWLTAGAIANLGPNSPNPSAGLGSGEYLGGENTTATNNIDNVMLGTQAFSGAHYKTGDRVEIAQLGDSLDQPEAAGTTTLEPVQTACQGGGSGYPNPCPASTVVSQLAWINLEWDGSGDAGSRPTAKPGATSNGGWGILARTGDETNSAGTPDWSHDGLTVAYTSATPEFSTMDGRLEGPTTSGTMPAGGFAVPPAGTSADIKTVPYSANATVGGAGGTATAVPGASDPTKNEYFPAFSPDDKLLAFNSVPYTASMYDDPLAEVYVVPFNAGAGGTAVRLAANDPVACTGVTSPGVQNTWPKWAPNPIPATDGGVADGGTPAPQVIDGVTYYWVTFSSTRSATSMGKEQIYVAGVTVDATGKVQTYAPIYLWNQTDTDNNLIPSWGEFALPPPTIMPPPPPVVIPK